MPKKDNYVSQYIESIKSTLGTWVAGEIEERLSQLIDKIYSIWFADGVAEEQWLMQSWWEDMNHDWLRSEYEEELIEQWYSPALVSDVDDWWFQFVSKRYEEWVNENFNL
jgi:hypothetical protein